MCTVPGWQFWQQEVWIFINHETGATKLVDLKNLSTEREREREREREMESKYEALDTATCQPNNNSRFFLFFIFYSL